MKAEEFKTLLDTLLESFPALTPDEERLAVHLYRLLSDGKPVKTAELAASARWDEKDAEAQLGEWPDVAYDVEFNDEKAVTGFWGLDLKESGHRFNVDGRDLFTWCAWDALFLPEILKKTALVESACPESKESIRLTVSPGKIETRVPARAVMSFVKLDPQTVQTLKDGIVPNFCSYIHFFASREMASQWTAKNEGAFILSLDEAMDLAGAANAARYGRALDIAS
ncbi:MAG TPA: organomercurial lyase [Nitrospiria bacterium]